MTDRHEPDHGEPGPKSEEGSAHDHHPTVPLIGRGDVGAGRSSRFGRLALVGLLALAGAVAIVGMTDRFDTASTPAPPASQSQEAAIDSGVRVVNGDESTARRSVEQIVVDPSEPPLPAEEVQSLRRPIVLLYGDSLAHAARDTFLGAFADRSDLEVIARTYGGTAICDWLEQMADDATTLRPGAVVVEFSGNALTPCMQDSGGRGLTGDAYFERYAADAERVIALFEVSRTQVIFAGAPLTRADAAGDQFTESRLNPLYRYLAEHRVGVSYTDAGAAVLVDGRFTDTLPCLPFEPCTGGLDATGQGINVVRAPDGVHFCPTGEDAVVGATVACSVWSSGAFRYGSALAVPIIERLELGVAAS